MQVHYTIHILIWVYYIKMDEDVEKAKQLIEKNQRREQHATGDFQNSTNGWGKERKHIQRENKSCTPMKLVDGIQRMQNRQI